MINRISLFEARTAFILTLLVSVGALGAALIGQVFFGLKPCEMCIYQRIPYALLILDSITALFLMRSVPKLNRIFLFMLASFFLAGAALAFFHFGIEQHWWTLEKGCSVGQLKGKTEAEIIAEILATPQADCSDVGWRIAGLSITVWNTTLSLVMAGYLLITAAKHKA